MLLDFGAARQARGQTVTVVFTACYAPVEQHFSKSDALGASSDLYSLGVVAYRCLLGGNESVLMDARERAHWINEGKADKDMSPAVVVGKGNYSTSLLRAIDWAMKVDAKDRPQSVAEMRVALAGKVVAEVEVETETKTEAKVEVKTKTKTKAKTKARQKDSVKSVSAKASAQVKATQGSAKEKFVEKWSGLAVEAAIGVCMVGGFAFAIAIAVALRNFFDTAHLAFMAISVIIIGLLALVFIWAPDTDTKKTRKRKVDKSAKKHRL